eukprot:TRINITY_DN24331_c0_g2_i3.p1 TRINITY_DN24331_c0_g2~~TRINITY_DN24331_c0_g2_i3.p1  ORF type:complete len:158 (-),score=1.68 TRINITY_DN24331_c0_g2_i3:292-765(-)
MIRGRWKMRSPRARGQGSSRRMLGSGSNTQENSGRTVAPMPLAGLAERCGEDIAAELVLLRASRVASSAAHTPVSPRAAHAPCAQRGDSNGDVPGSAGIVHNPAGAARALGRRGLGVVGGERGDPDHVLTRGLPLAEAQHAATGFWMNVAMYSQDGG